MPQRFRFGVYEFDQATGELSKGGTRLALQPQVATLLELLLEAPGELVKRDAIRKALWDPDTNVDFELGVNRCIRQLRAALNDNGSKSMYLETLARRGYRFIAPVSMVDDDRSPAPPRSNVALQSTAQRGAVAVLPFANLSRETEDEYFADGLTEEIINALAQVRELKVIARTSAFAFKGRNEDIRQIGQALGAGMILEGSIRRSGKRVRVTAQLIRTSDAVHIFSRRYDHELEDVFALQDEISTDVASQLMASIVTPLMRTPSDTRPHISVHSKRPTENHAAYQALLEGRFQFRKFEPAAFEKALQCLQLCLRLDPGCAAAYTEMAEQYVGLATASRGRSLDLIAKAAETAGKAVELDPKDGAAHAMLGVAAAIGDYSWQAAETHFGRARQLGNGSNVRIPYAVWYLAPLGRLAEAVSEVEAALVNDPLLAIGHSAKGWLLFHARHYEQASECCLRALELNPQLSNALHNLVYIRLFQDRLQDAEGYARTLMATLGSSPSSLECLAVVQARAGDREGAQKSLAKIMELAGGGSAMALCAVHAILGGVDTAFSALRQAIDNREPRVVWIRTAPWCDPLRCDQRFSKALKQINLA